MVQVEWIKNCPSSRELLTGSLTSGFGALLKSQVFCLALPLSCPGLVDKLVISQR